jgi:hypothetical protein
LLNQSGIKLKTEREKWFRKYAEEKEMNGSTENLYGRDFCCGWW